MPKFEVKAEETERKTTRRGEWAWSKIRLVDGPIVGELDDDPSAICATVRFKEIAHKHEFLLEARQVLHDLPYDSDSMYISEYARKLSMDADLALLEKEKSEPSA